jgi:hypothetical protein
MIQQVYKRSVELVQEAMLEHTEDLPGVYKCFEFVEFITYALEAKFIGHIDKIRKVISML